jgi:hypothetical protein
MHDGQTFKGGPGDTGVHSTRPSPGSRHPVRRELRSNKGKFPSASAEEFQQAIREHDAPTYEVMAAHKLFVVDLISFR